MKKCIILLLAGFVAGCGQSCVERTEALRSTLVTIKVVNEDNEPLEKAAIRYNNYSYCFTNKDGESIVPIRVNKSCEIQIYQNEYYVTVIKFDRFADNREVIVVMLVSKKQRTKNRC